MVYSEDLKARQYNELKQEVDRLAEKFADIRLQANRYNENGCALLEIFWETLKQMDSDIKNRDELFKKADECYENARRYPERSVSYLSRGNRHYKRAIEWDKIVKYSGKIAKLIHNSVDMYFDSADKLEEQAEEYFNGAYWLAYCLAYKFNDMSRIEMLTSCLK